MKFVLTALVALGMALPAMASGSSTSIQFTKKNTLVLNDAVMPDTVAALIEEARRMDSEMKSGEPIYLFLNTPGGSIQDGLELIENLKSLNRPVHTVSLFAASMGFQIVQNLGQRYVLENSVLMSHEAYGGFKGSFSHGSSQLDAIYGLWLKRIEEMDKITVARTNGKQTLESYRKAYSKDLWLTGQQSVEGGYADQVVSARCDTSMSGTKSQIVYFMGMPIQLIFSECPLNVNILDIQVLVPTNKGLIRLTDFLAAGGVSGWYRDNYGENKEPALYTTEAVSVAELTKKLEEYKKQARKPGAREIIRMY